MGKGRKKCSIWQREAHLHLPHITQVVSETLSFPGGNQASLEEQQQQPLRQPICLHTHVCQANTHTHIHTLHKLTQHTQTRGHMKNLHMLILFTFKTLQKQFVHKISCFFLLSFGVRNSHHTHATHQHTHAHTLRQFRDGACLRTTRFTAVPSPVRATSELCNKRMWVEREALLSR